jgi:putative ABC transport system permease protein
MNFESVRIALQGIAANKLRSALTMLGVLIGVGSVIVLVAVGTGSKARVAKQFESLGSNTVTVSTGGFGGPGGSRNGTQSRQIQITNADVTALQNSDNCPDCVAVVPIVMASSVTGTYNGATYSPSQFYGTTAAFSAVRNYPVKTGSFFTDDDVANRSKVVVIGTTVLSNLYGANASAADAIGTEIKFGATQWEVIGVLKSKGSNGVQDQDDVVVAPSSAVQDTLAGGGTYSQLVVQAASPQAAAVVEGEITQTLNALHKITGTATSSFRVLNQASLLSSQQASSETLTVLLGAVAAISLLVGGIGVMNIMLVTVTERTREIGIRKAIGAQKSAILGQFLVEATMVAMIGGLLGVAGGLIGSQFRIAGIQPVVAPYSVFLAFGVSVLTGLFFGFYPANRAAALRPIDALRYE